MTNRNDRCRCGRTRCYIIPPYLLEYAGLNVSHDQSQQIREQRSLIGARTLDKAIPKKVIEVYDAGGKETLGRLVATPETVGKLDTTQPRAFRIFSQLLQIRNFYATVFGYEFGVKATINFGTEFSNAFWDGEKLAFGNGDGQIFRPFTNSLTVTAHEAAHAVIEDRSGLGYQGENGALNEHMADVLAISVEQWVEQAQPKESSWFIGSEIWQQWLFTQAKGVRNLKTPGGAYNVSGIGRDPQPNSMATFVRTKGDNGGVHINSGIPNRAFALASEAIGGAVWSNLALVWWDALAECDGVINFSQFATLTVKYAIARFGKDALQTTALLSAWKTVGVAVPLPSGTPANRTNATNEKSEKSKLASTKAKARAKASIGNTKDDE